jgi:hypothetical protein
LSLDDCQEIVAEVLPIDEPTRPGGAAGGVVSGHAAVAIITVVTVERLPAASTASTPNE